ncbi:hypothetical protein CALVIDRAFT_538813 [Calocera viscosa TUFC12733]|uniref:C2 NT-type domain-containing protein n=1 Tax=Calocera viscosa (strain TUFC12733) TaxID=1330018 RepID=A0A167KJC0_CALVF|nr:hypothetical protein CALVIDRAFT_538813 [Calocera viscosa TUFC12733]
MVLGTVVVNLAEYVGEGVVTRRYLLRDSKTNATLKVGSFSLGIEMVLMVLLRSCRSSSPRSAEKRATAARLCRRGRSSAPSQG